MTSRRPRLRGPVCPVKLGGMVQSMMVQKIRSGTARIVAAVSLACAVALTFSGCSVTPSTPSQFALVQYPAAGFSGLYAQTAAARRSIDMEIYELDDPVEERALVAAHRRGVAVRVLLDAAYQVRAANQPAYAALQAGGVPVRFGAASTIFHIKTTTFDATTSDISTANLTPRYYATTRDAEIVDSYPVQVTAIEKTFDSDWNGDNPASDESSAPGLVWSPDAEQAMIDRIDSATTGIDFTSEELSDPYIYQALAKVAQRGVRCKVVMMDDPEWSKAFGQVTAAGCRVHVLPDTAKGLYMHEKLVLVDPGTTHASVLIGSQNASYSSLAFNRELGIELTRAQAPAIVAAVTRTFDDDFAAASSWP